MDTEIKTTLLEYEKSTFLLDLVKHENGELYIAIQQTIQLNNNKTEVQKIKINPTIIDDLISVLNEYRGQLPKIKKKPKNYLSPERYSEIVKRYLKGNIRIKDLAIQFDTTEEIIEQVLRNKGIAIINEEAPKKKKVFRFRRNR